MNLASESGDGGHGSGTEVLLSSVVAFPLRPLRPWRLIAFNERIKRTPAQALSCSGQFLMYCLRSLFSKLAARNDAFATSWKDSTPISVVLSLIGR